MSATPYPDDTEPEKEEFVDIGPPPCQYLRAQTKLRDDLIKSFKPGQQSSSAKDVRGRLLLSEDIDTPSTLTESADLAKTSFGGASDSDIFAERKKKLRSPVMAQSMPDFRDFRSHYNRDIGRSLQKNTLPEINEAKQSRPKKENDVFDELLSGL